MKKILINMGYFLKETKTMIRLNLTSNILSVFSTGLIFFIFAMVISGWWISNQVVEAIQGEAEINVYYGESIDANGTIQLVKKIEGIDGVREARIVDEDEAYSRMEEILGKEAQVLEVFDDNPFSAFIEVKIDLEKMNNVLKQISQLEGIEHVRDNREVLDRLHNIAGALKLLGYLVVVAVSICTLVIISHIIRLGIYNSREQINTLRLLGAPEYFIAFPFLLQGFLLTFGGGILAAILAGLCLKYVYIQMAGPLPFIPLPPIGSILFNMAIATISISAILGVVGSSLGLSAAKSR